VAAEEAIALNCVQEFIADPYPYIVASF